MFVKLIFSYSPQCYKKRVEAINQEYREVLFILLKDLLLLLLRTVFMYITYISKHSVYVFSHKII